LIEVTSQSHRDCIQYSSSHADLPADGPTKRSNIVPAPRSNKVHAVKAKRSAQRIRRTPLKDKQTVERIRAFANALDRGVPSISNLPHSPLSVAQSPSPTPCIKAPISLPKGSNDNLVEWEKTGSLTKLTAATWSLLTEERQPVAFSFNLTPESEAAAKANASGPIDWLKRRLDKQLTKRFGKGGIPYFFALDIEEGRLHIHGSFLPLKGSEYHHDQVRDAMKAAWGVWRLGDGRENPKQTDFRPLYSDGWISYALLERRKVAKAIGDDRTFTMTNDLRRDAQRTYNEIRDLMSHPEWAWWRSL
jgi:hypothetical protein